MHTTNPKLKARVLAFGFGDEDLESPRSRLREDLTKNERHSVEFFDRKSLLMQRALAIGLSERCVILVWFDTSQTEMARSRALRLIEAVRVHPAVSQIARPAAVGASRPFSKEPLVNAGSFGFLLAHAERGSELVDDFISVVSARMPRRASRAPSPFIELSDGEASGDQPGASDFDSVFARWFGIKSGPNDQAILSAWASEIPEKAVVNAVGSDPDSGWSASSVSKRIERLRAAAPLLYRDAAGNIAKSRLARDLLKTAALPAVGGAESWGLIQMLPDVDRCIELLADDALMSRTFLDDEARMALISVANRRAVESSRQGGRPAADQRSSQLAEELHSAYVDSHASRFATEADFRKAFGRALFAIADAQFDQRLGVAS